MRVAIIHDWLVGMRGGEKCLEAFCEIFPDADVYTLVYLPDKISPTLRRMKVRASWINRLPMIARTYRYYLPLFPRTIERFELGGYDLILSSSHCVAKGVYGRGALQVAYIHAPMRYVWDLHDDYFGHGASLLQRLGMSMWRRYLQDWDLRSAQRVHYFIANSNNVAGKIRKLYGRETAVIYPPVQTEQFFIANQQESFYLIVSALVPYKKIEVAIEAFNQLRLPLKIAGDGPLRNRLAKTAGANIEFLGWVDNAELAKLYARCQALIFPGEEDFGITPLEAQASGRPVIAYGKGGVLESVIPLNERREDAATRQNPTGVFFRDSTAASLIEAVQIYQQASLSFDHAALRRHAERFSRNRFKSEIKGFLDARLRESWEDRVDHAEAP